jgi:hypothetical protein
MKSAIAIIFSILTISSFGQKLNIGLHISNPIRDTKVGWFDIDGESFDNYNLKDRSIATELTSQYSLEKIDLRLRFNFMHINILEYQQIFGGGLETTADVRGIQNKFTVAPGIFMKKDFERLTLSFGLEGIFTSHGEFKMDVVSIQSDSLSGAVLFDDYGKVSIPSGFAIGLGAPFNFGFKLGKRFVIQAEYSPSMYYSKLGGTTVTTGYTNAPSYSEYGPFYTEDEYEGFTTMEHRFSLGIVYWLKL